MSVSVDKFNAHQVHSSLEGVKDSLNNAAAGLSDPTDHDQFERIKAAAEYIGQRLRFASPYLTAEGVLNNLDKNLEKVRDELTAFHSDGDKAHVSNAIGATDSAVRQAGSITVFGPGQEGEASLSEEISRFREGAESVVGDLETKQQEFDARIAKLSKNMNELKQSIDSFSANVREEARRFEEV